MSKIAQIKKFNDILDQLFNYLEDTFPFYKSDIILTKNSIHFIRKSNPRLVVEQFLQYVEPYSEQIFSYDEDFFMNFEQNMSLDQENMLYGLKLKSLWIENGNTDTDESLRQKAYIFDYFHKLLRTATLV
jgi:hypothetical protein